MNVLNFKMNRCSHCLVGTFNKKKKLAKLGNQIKVESTPDDRKFTNIFQIFNGLVFFCQQQITVLLLLLFLGSFVFLRVMKYCCFPTGNSDVDILE